MQQLLDTPVAGPFPRAVPALSRPSSRKVSAALQACGAGGITRGVAVCLCLFTIAAFVLRFWKSDVPFHSGDFATMPFLATCSGDLSWIAAHSYGPLLPAIVFVFTRCVTAFGGAMTETLWRLPLVVIGTLHVPLTYLLMRRLGGRPWTSTLAAGVVAFSLPLVNDARYPWGYELLGTVVATAALWAWLRAMDIQTRRSAWLAGALVAAYLVSHLTVHALPIVLIAVAVQSRGIRNGVRELLRPGMLLTVACAVATTFICYIQFDGGIIARMLKRADDGVVSAGTSPWSDLIAMWTEHLGPPWMVLSVCAIAVGIYWLFRGDRRGIPALWAVAHSVPLILLVNSAGIGRASSYHMQGSFAAALSACFVWEAIATRRRIGAVVAWGAVASMAFASFDAVFAGRRHAAWAGVTDYGLPRPDPGYKSAGWYVRVHVPKDAVVLTMHDTMGLEYPCATYYLGRHIAATEDSTFDEQRRIVEAVGDRVEVIIADATFKSLVDRIPGMAMAARITCSGEPIVLVFARAGLGSPAMDIDVTTGNASYDRECAPRSLPVPVARNARTAEVNRVIQRVHSSPVTPPPGQSSPG